MTELCCATTGNSEIGRIIEGVGGVQMASARTASSVSESYMLAGDGGLLGTASVSDREAGSAQPLQGGPENAPDAKRQLRKVPRSTCGGCSKWWGGMNTAHCAGCHETFSGLTAFDAHRSAGGSFGSCKRPEVLGLELKDRADYQLWRYPGRDDDEGVW